MIVLKEASGLLHLSTHPHFQHRQLPPTTVHTAHINVIGSLDMA